MSWEVDDEGMRSRGNALLEVLPEQAAANPFSATHLILASYQISISMRESRNGIFIE